MDTLRLLARGTKGKGTKPSATQQRIIPSAESAKPQLFSEDRPTKKRRLDDADDDDGLHYHDALQQTQIPSKDDITTIRSTLKQHKIKVAWMKVTPAKKAKRSREAVPARVQRLPLFPAPLHDFSQSSLAACNVSQQLAKNIKVQGYDTATEVQMAAIPLLTSLAKAATESAVTVPDDCPNLLTVAPTGSGKTLAFLIPTMSRLLAARGSTDIIERRTQALVLAPTKELVGQIVNEGKIMLRGIDLKITAYKKDMRLEEGDEADARTVAKPDILVSTPGALAAAIEASAPLSGVRYLILDEADVLLDPLFREQTVNIWKSLLNPDLRVSLWSATMGSNIEELALALTREQQQTSGANENTPFVRLVVGLKDSAVPNIRHRLVYAATEQGKLMGLRSLLHPATVAEESLRPPFIVFTQTIDRAVALHSELLYDIPAEAGGISRIAVLHSNLSDTARSNVMTRFRKGDIWVLITTDLLSRGIDFRGINGVVNYDIPTSSAAYVHRAGRTGRAGREGGVAVTLYSKEDIPYLKHIANIIAAAQKQGGLDADAGVQQWLLDALPTLSKNDKQKFKKHGIEARTARGMANDPKTARRARISTKSGYLRRTENNRKGAIEGSRRRAQAIADDDGSERDFAGFD